jgi:hypothetical protein
MRRDAMRTWTWRLLLIVTVLAGVAAYGGDGLKETWTFEDDTPGAVPKGFTPAVGEWTVVSTGEGKVLAQSARNADPVFNVALVDDTQARDVDLSVRLKAFAGELDQGGGLVWRARDAKNYYVARFNHLEDNFRVYKVVDGVRSRPFQNADVKHHDGWTTLRVTMKGDHIECYLDGKKHLDVRDVTFPGAGKIVSFRRAGKKQSPRRRGGKVHPRPPDVARAGVVSPPCEGGQGGVRRVGREVRRSQIGTSALALSAGVWDGNW